MSGLPIRKKEEPWVASLKIIKKLNQKIIRLKFRMLFITTDYADYTDFLSAGFNFVVF